MTLTQCEIYYIMLSLSQCHQVSKYLLNAYYMPYGLLDSEVTEESKINVALMDCLDFNGRHAVHNAG